MTDLDRDSWMFYKGKPIDFPVPKGVVGPIYVVGDSHVQVFSYSMPSMFTSKGHRSISAYAASFNLTVNDPKNSGLYDFVEGVPKGSKILMGFGEIDCRHYIPPLAKEQNKSIEDIVNTVITRYTTDSLMFLKNRNYKVLALGPYPCPYDFLYAHPYEEILEAKQIFNIQLQKFCEEQEMIFIPIFYEVLKNEWHKKPLATYFNDSTHLGPCMIPVVLNSLKGETNDL